MAINVVYASAQTKEVAMFTLVPVNRRFQPDLFNPFQDMKSLEKSFFNGSMLKEFKIDIHDEGNAYELDADLPGFDKKDIHVDVDGDFLTISGERQTHRDEKDEAGNYIRRERSYGSFSRSFNIADVASENISGEYKDGVLKLTLPKKGDIEPQKKAIDIQ